MQELTTGKREKEMNNIEWINREEWRRNVKLLTQKDMRTLILCTLKNETGIIINLFNIIMHQFKVQMVTKIRS